MDPQIRILVNCSKTCIKGINDLCFKVVQFPIISMYKMILLLEIFWNLNKNVFVVGSISFYGAIMVFEWFHKIVL